ncbi:hypothetical protein LCGC14_0579230 [marine sediment metagenome]|uniref:Uncharacterized protein n=1 Tax=marine sediment metagenome TaxID=412755 RepID=A0A0F9RLU3_9ZZZZ
MKTETKYTKGEWYSKQNTIWSKQGNYAQKVAVASLATSGKIKEITKNPEEAIANAKRIVQCVNNLDALLKALKTITLSMKVHPDCEPNSEFADMVSISEQAIKTAE